MLNVINMFLCLTCFLQDAIIFKGEIEYIIVCLFLGQL